MTGSLPCDIVILPTSKLGGQAITTSERLEHFQTLYTLKDGTYFPHASLYMTQLKVADLDKVTQLLSAIAARTPRLNLESNRYDQTDGYIDAEYIRTSALDALQ